MRKTTIAVISLLTMSFAGAALAAAPDQVPTAANTVCPGYTQSYNSMTDDQRAQIAERQKQMLEQRKQMVQQQVERGYITQEQANQRMAWMDQYMNNGAMMGPGMMGGSQNGMMGSGTGMMGPGMGMMGSGMGYGMMNSVAGTRL